MENHSCPKWKSHRRDAKDAEKSFFICSGSTGANKKPSVASEHGSQRKISLCDLCAFAVNLVLKEAPIHPKGQ
jgi:hypothetical protein